ncbi:pyroglutamyl peptidase [Streptomyces sp. SudanB182_2057]|uniref:pyroglutamyl peptidase n=1 Tax=Streptomyces sp. SudanB182_2057 TaxID=3035281 RepID=UPI003F576B04
MDGNVYYDEDAGQGAGGQADWIVVAGSMPTVIWQPAVQHFPQPGNGTDAAEQTVEEARVDEKIPQEILSRGGMGDAQGWQAELSKALDGAQTLSDAERAMAFLGGRLWQRAVDRAQGRTTSHSDSDLPVTDDRPLYWTRLTLARALRAWCARSPLDEADRQRVLLAFERASRGIGRTQSQASPPPQEGLRAVITGFDPFQLDRGIDHINDDLRHSNPAGCLALALDGTTLDTDAGPAHITTMMFPLRWHAFAQGIVEHALTPYFQPGPHRVDLFMTISQGRLNQFDVEHTNGAWRGVGWDNLNQRAPGPVPIPPGVPTVHPQPQWTTTTLPASLLADQPAAPFPVYHHTGVTEIPADSDKPAERKDGPTPNSLAREGGGGDYLSNEIGYRATLLRDACRLRVPGGHLHTPKLLLAPDNQDPATGHITDPVLERYRDAVLAQARALLTTALGTLAAR